MTPKIKAGDYVVYKGHNDEILDIFGNEIIFKRSWETPRIENLTYNKTYLVQEVLELFGGKMIRVNDDRGEEKFIDLELVRYDIRRYRLEKLKKIYGEL